MRNKNIEAFRGIAILLLLFYHFTVVNGVFYEGKYIFINEGFCQFAMIAFFSISGYGSYLHFNNNDKSGKKEKWYEYVKNRFIKIAPAYYLNLLILVLFATSGVYLAKSGFKPLVIYALFLQNIFASVRGDLNGVTWTLAVMIQFYFVAKPMYKLIRKYRVIGYLLMLIIAIAANLALCKCVTIKGLDQQLYVVYSIRELVSVLDAFAIGMLSAYATDKFEHLKISNWLRIATSICLGILGIASFFLITSRVGVWGDSIWCFSWKVVLSWVAALIMWFMAPCACNYDSLIGRAIQFVAKVEYNTYLWHLCIWFSIKDSSIIKKLQNRNAWYSVLFMICISIAVGYFFTMLTERKTRVEKN